MIDARVGNGTHAAYLRGQLGKVSKQRAKEAFEQMKFDAAFEAAKACARFGSDDGGILNQLKNKAADSQRARGFHGEVEPERSQAVVAHGS